MNFQQKLKKIKGIVKIGVVAERAGISAQSMSNYIHRGNGPRYDVAVRIAKALGVEVSWMLDDEQDWPPVWTDRNRVFANDDAATPSPHTQQGKEANAA